MSDFIFSLTPPDKSQTADTTQNLFDSPLWQQHLNRAFACRTLYGRHQPTDTLFTITLFRVGLFNIGYLGFPVGSASLSPAAINTLKSANYPAPVHILRFAPSAFGSSISNQDAVLDLPAATVPETAITDLQTWDMAHLPKLRRDIKKANRSGLAIREVRSASDAEYLYRSYKATIHRHDGSLRYSPAYFRGLVKLSKVTGLVRCLLATKDDQATGFITTIWHGTTVYYLHGGFNPAFRTYGVSDKLVYKAIEQAQRDGAQCFNLMASPADQPSLIRFKEKWGAVTRPQNTYTIDIDKYYAKPLRLALAAHGLGKKVLRRLPHL